MGAKLRAAGSESQEVAGRCQSTFPGPVFACDQPEDIPQQIEQHEQRDGGEPAPRRGVLAVEAQITAQL